MERSQGSLSQQGVSESGTVDAISQISDGSIAADVFQENIEARARSSPIVGSQTI